MLTRTMTTLLTTATLALLGCGENRFATGEVVVGEDPDVFDAVLIELEHRDGTPRDLVAEGATFELSLHESPGDFQSDFRFETVDLQVTGTYRIDGDQIVFSDGPFEDDDRELQRTYDVIIAEDAMLIESATAVFDIDNDGATEVVELKVGLERRR